MGMSGNGKCRMNELIPNCVAIDTNVFGQLGDCSENTCKHINNLLLFLIKHETYLLVDDGGKIAKEYKHHLNKQRFKEAYDKRDEVRIMEYWMHPDRRKKVSVVNNELWVNIKSVIFEPNEVVDRILVYVAFINKRVLISNDNRHITNRRGQLQEVVVNLQLTDADVLTSEDAHNQTLRSKPPWLK